MTPRRAGLLLAAAAALTYLVLVGRQITRPLQYDDANFALAARAVAETGLPYGNQGWMSERGDFSQREQWALWHPPLYVYLSGLVVRLAGWGPAALRLLGVLGGLGSAGLTYLLARDVTRGPPGQRALAGGLAAALVLLCPLVVQSTLIVDIDLALLLPLSLLFLVVYIRLEATRRAWLALAPLFGLLLWTKMTNPLPLLAVVLMWQALRGQPARALAHGLGIGLAGGVLFGLSWLLVGRWLGMPLAMPFGVNLVQWQDSADVARRAYATPGAFVEGLQPTAIWLGPGLVALGLVGVAVRAAHLVACWRFRCADLLIGLLAVFVLGYVNKSAGWFPKYQVALVPLLAALGAPLVVRAGRPRPRVTALVLGATGAAGALVDLWLVRDDWALRRTWAIEPTAAGWLGLVVLVGVLVGLPGRAAAGGALAALVGLALGWSLATDVYQAGVPYATTYWYGTSGTADAARWVDAHLVDQTYVASKEVAVRARDQRYVDQDSVLYALATGRGFDGTWAGERVAALVTWQREPYVADLFARAAPTAGYRESARFGDYVVYERAVS